MELGVGVAVEEEVAADDLDAHELGGEVAARQEQRVGGQRGLEMG